MANQEATLEFDSIFRMVRLDNPDLGFGDSLVVAERIFNRPSLQGSCIHRMPEGMSSFLYGTCVRCGARQ